MLLTWHNDAGATRTQHSHCRVNLFGRKPVGHALQEVRDREPARLAVRPWPRRITFKRAADAHIARRPSGQARRSAPGERFRQWQLQDRPLNEAGNSRRGVENPRMAPYPEDRALVPRQSVRLGLAGAGIENQAR